MSEEMKQVPIDLSHVFELLSNKKNDILDIDYSNDNDSYPTVRAVKNYVDNLQKCVYDAVDIIDDKVSVVYNTVSMIDTSDSVYDADRWTEDGTMSIIQRSGSKFIAGGDHGYVIYDGNISNLDNYDITLNLTANKTNTLVFINDDNIGTLPTSQTSILFKKRNGVVKVVYDNNQYDASAVQIIASNVMSKIRYTIDVVLYQGMIYDVIDSIPSKTSDLTNDSGFLTSHQSLSGYLQTSDVKDNLTSTDTNKPLSAKQGKELKTLVDGKQATLVSGTSIKTVNNESLLGSGNIDISSGSGSDMDIVTAWEPTLSDNKVASEKLVKNSLDGKANSTHTHTSLQKTTITSGNLDDYTDTGWYSYSTTNSSSITNTPENVGSVMEVLDDYDDGKYIVQKVYTLPSDNNSIIYYRQKYDSTGWGKWIRIDGRDKITQGNIQGGVNLLGQWLISYTNAGAGAVATQQNNVLFHGDEVVRINNSSISDTKKYTDMYWETPYTEFGYNDVFTFSFYAKGTNNAQIRTYFYGESGYITVKRLSSNSTVSGNDTEYSSFNDGNTTFTLGSDWQFYTVTYKLNSIGTTTAIKKPVIRVFGGTDCYVSCAKLERGFNATDFNNGTGIKSIKIEATSIRTKDLNNYTKTGFYYNNVNTDCAYISNLPVSNKAFFLTVENCGGSTTYLKQTCTVYSPVETYVRVKNAGTWGDWKKLISVDDASSSKGLADDPYNGLVGTSTKYAREDHAHGKLYHWSTGGVSTATYVDLLEFTMTTSYQDIPITFVVRRRAKDRVYYVSIRFSNTDISTSTYSVTSFKHWGDVTAQTFYLRKVADNTYRLCVYKTANDIYYIDDMVNFNSGITITKIASANGNYGTTAPSGSAPDLYTSTQINTYTKAEIDALIGNIEEDMLS